MAAAAQLQSRYADAPALTSHMANAARKTEHSGPKKGRGAYYGRKANAKHQSKRKRREISKRLIRDYGESQT